MEKKTNMADEVPSWNIRHNKNDVIIDTESYKSENIDPEISDELKKKFTSMIHYIVKNPLWVEMNTIKCVIYKHQHQHCKEKYFQGMKRIHKHLTRLREIKLENLFSSFLQKIPKKDSKNPEMLRYPTAQATECLLFKIMGAAKLIARTVGLCKSTLNYSGGHLSHGFFVSLHIVLAASLSRFWILLKDFLYNIFECYEMLLQWLDNLQGAVSEKDRIYKKGLPKCLKTWIINSELDFTLFETPESKTVSHTPHTSEVFEKLFSFTPESVEKVIIATNSVISNKVNMPSLNDNRESLDGSLNTPGNVPNSSWLSPCNLFKDVSSYSKTASLEKCDVVQHKLRERKMFPVCKRLHLDEDKSDFSARNASETMTANNGPCILRKGSCLVLHYPNTKLKYSIHGSTFKMPCLKLNRKVTFNSKGFEVRRKLQKRSSQRKTEQKSRRKGHYRKVIFLKTKSNKLKRIGNCPLNKQKRTLNNQDEEYQNRWRRKIGLIVSKIKGELQNLMLSSNIKQWINVPSNGNGKECVCLSSKAQHINQSEGSKNESLPGNMPSLKRLAAHQGLHPKTGKLAKHCSEVVKNCKRLCSESSYPLMKEETNAKMLHQRKEDFVDLIFKTLDV